MRSSSTSPAAIAFVSMCSVYVPAAATSSSVSGVLITETVFVPEPAAVTAIYVIVRSRSPIGIRKVSSGVTLPGS